MDAFEVLGIAFTKDVKEIRRAYSRLLAKYSPETDPEGFQRLRAAYEVALAKVHQEETETVFLSPIDQFMKDFEKNYRCFEKRLDIDSWTELLERDICYNIESSKEVSYRILTFIMDNYNFPTEVWRLFDSYFSWKSKKDSLYSQFPRPFIDFVVYKISNGSNLDYNLLTACQDDRRDEFISELGKIRNAIDDVDLYTAYSSIKLADEICPEHPSLNILRARYLAIDGQVQGALNIFNSILEEDKDNYDALYYRVELYSRLGRLEEAYQDGKRLIELEPEALGVYYSLTRYCISLQKYEEAISYAEKLSDISQYRGDVKVLLNSAYSFYIDSINKNREALDDKEKYKLAEAYFKTSKIVESYNILQELITQSSCNAEAYSLYCRVLMIKKNYELAYVTVCEALANYEDSYELNFLKADILEELGKYDEALQCANTAIELDPSAAHCYKNKAAALLGLELYEDCLEACEEALDKYLYLVEAYIIKMKAFKEINLLDEALEVFNRASSYGIKDGKLYYEKARVLMHLKKYDEAIQNCQLALEEDENELDYSVLKAMCMYYKGDYEESKKLFEEIIEKDSSCAIAYFHITLCWLKLSNPEAAIAVADKAIVQEYGYLDRFHNLKGIAFQELNRYDKGLEEYRKALSYNPTVSGYYYSLGRCLNELDRYEEAIEYLKKYIELEPEDADGYVSMGYSLYKEGRFQECIEYCDKAIEISPDYTTPHQNKGWALLKLNRIEEAEKACAIALKLDGNHEGILLLKLRLLYLRNLYQDSLIVCDRILELNPRDEETKNLRQELIDKINEANKEKTGFFKSLFK